MGFPADPPPPPPSPTETLLIGVAIGVFVTLGAVGLAVVLVDGNPICAGCPGETPLGTTLGIHNGTGVCPAGNGSSMAACVYTFALTLSEQEGGPNALSPQDLSFDLLTATNQPIHTVFSVTLVASSGCGITSWNSSSFRWGNSVEERPCPAPSSPSTAIEPGDSLLLTPLPFGGLPFSHVGDQLLVDAFQGGYSGTIMATID
jgi:hypothetical protein